MSRESLTMMVVNTLFTGEYNMKERKIFSKNVSKMHCRHPGVLWSQMPEEFSDVAKPIPFTALAVHNNANKICCGWDSWMLFSPWSYFSTINPNNFSSAVQKFKAFSQLLLACYYLASWLPLWLIFFTAQQKSASKPSNSTLWREILWTK